MFAIGTRLLTARSYRGWKTVLSRILVITSIIGFSVQVIQVSIRYFSFTTTTSVAYEMPEYIDAHSTAICIQPSDLFNDVSLLQKTGVRYERHSGRVTDFIREHQLTIAQVFDNTPDPEFTIKSCSFRLDFWINLSEVNRTTCLQEFNVTKFYLQAYMCYVFEPITRRRLHTEDATRSTYNKGRIHSIYLNSSFDGANYMIPIAFRGENPVKSRDYAPRLWKIKDVEQGNKRQRKVLVYLTPFDIKIKLLPSPYDTRCVPVSDEYSSECRRRCLVHAFAPFSRVPGYEILREKYDLKPLGTLDVLDKNVSAVIAKLHTDCKTRCSFKACVEGFTVTRMTYRMSEFHTIGFSLMTPTDPVISLSSQPTMYFVEFFCFIAGCFGIWFGVSFLSLTSLKLLRVPRNSHSRRRRH